MNWIKSYLFRRRIKVTLGIMMYPAKRSLIGQTFKPQIDATLLQAKASAWTPEMCAAVIITGYFLNFLRDSTEPEEREALATYLKSGAPKDLKEEWAWVQSVRSKKNADLPPLVFRFNWISGMLAIALVKWGTIDVASKGLFVTTVAWTVSGYQKDVVDSKFQELLALVGKTERLVLKGKR